MTALLLGLAALGVAFPIGYFLARAFPGERRCRAPSRVSVYERCPGRAASMCLDNLCAEHCASFHGESCRELFFGSPERKALR